MAWSPANFGQHWPGATVPQVQGPETDPSPADRQAWPRPCGKSICPSGGPAVSSRAMSPDPTTAPSAERRQAVWPWLLLPLVALTLFFALRSVKQAPLGPAAHPEAAEAAPSEATGSR